MQVSGGCEDKVWLLLASLAYKLLHPPTVSLSPPILHPMNRLRFKSPPCSLGIVGTLRYKIEVKHIW